MSGRRSRRKGHDWEREVARRLREIFGPQVRRGLQYQDGAATPDVIVPCFHVECKVGARPPIIQALEQAERDAKPGLWPVAVCKQDRKPPTVTMRFEDWLELLGAWWREVEGRR